MRFFSRNGKIQQDVIDLEIYELLNQFTDASLEMPIRRVRNLFEYKNTYSVVFGYFFGAMDYIVQYKEIDYSYALELFKKYLSKNFTNGDKEKANELYVLIINFSKTSEGRKYMLVGRNAFKKWLENKPEIIADLNRLLFQAHIV